MNLIIFVLFCSIFILIPGCEKKQKPKGDLQVENVYEVKQLKETEDFITYLGDSDEEKIYLLGISKKKLENSNELEIMKIAKGKSTGNRILLSGTDKSKKTFFRKASEGYLILQKEETGYKFSKFHEDGILESSVLLSIDKIMNIKIEKINLRFVQFSEQETIYALDNIGNLYYFQKNGKLEKMVKLESEKTFDYMFLKNESLYCISNYNEKCEIYEYTIKSLQTIKNGGTIKAILHIPKLPSNNHYFFIPDGSQQDIQIYSTIGVYKYFPDSEEIKLICKWTDSGINAIDILQVLFFSEKHFLVLQGDPFSIESDPKQTLCYLYIKEKTIKKEKQTLTLAVLQQWVEIDEMVAEYNRQSKDSTIVVKEYFQMEDPIQAMHNDIISGNPPDMVDMTSLNVKDYSKKGLLTNLTKLINHDSEISEETFVNSIIKALKVDGKLYFLPSWFDMKVLAGNKNTIQGRTSWTFQEFEKLYQEKEKDTFLFGNKTKQNLLYEFSNSMLNGFIDWENRTANFKHKEFQTLLSFIKNFSENFDTSIKMFKKMQKGKVLFRSIYLGTLETEYCFYNQIFHNMELIGYPSVQGSGISANSSAPMIAITTLCKEKEKAFEFLKMFWTYDYQKKCAVMTFPFPTRKDVLKKKLEYASASKSYTDEDGQEVIAVNGTTSFNGIEVKKKPLKKKDIKIILNLINRIEWFDYRNSEREDIIAIIAEESQDYFNGDKTIEEVEDIIQSRVGIYLGEKE